MSLDVFIVNYHSEMETVNCVRSLLGTSLRVFGPRFHIADNGSSRDWKTLDLPSTTKIYRLPTNVGFGKAVNLLSRMSTAPYFILVNPDSLFLEGPWPDLFHFLEKTPDVGIVGPRILDPDGSVQGSARSFPSLSTVLFGRSSPLTRRFPNNRFSKRNVLHLNGDDSQPRLVDWVSGACMMIRQSAFKALGGFDERFFLFWEDTDLCARMKKAGWHIVYHPALSIIHHVGTSRGHAPLQSRLHFHRSAFRLFCKHYPRLSGLLAPAVALTLAAHFVLSPLWNRSRLS